MADLTLYGDSAWVSPWVFHALVALEEIKRPYRLERLPLPLLPAAREQLVAKAILGKVPCLVHGELWLTESSAISEYLAEEFPTPALLPTDRDARAHARQVMSWLRTALQPLRDDRPTTSVFQKPITTPLSEQGREAAAELVRVSEALLAPDAKHLFDAWSIADADLSLALMRLVANGDPVPPRISEYALAQWNRPSIRKYLSYVPTNRLK